MCNEKEIGLVDIREIMTLATLLFIHAVEFSQRWNDFRRTVVFAEVSVHIEKMEMSQDRRKYSFS